MSVSAGESAGRSALDFVYVGFNSRVVALDRRSGETVWHWKSPQGSGYVAVLLDGDQVIASVQGYTYALDPVTGEERWSNPLKGFGIGTPCLASANGNGAAQLYSMLGQQEVETQQAQAASQTHQH